MKRKSGALSTTGITRENIASPRDSFFQHSGAALHTTAKGVLYPDEAGFPRGKAMLQIAYFGGQRQDSIAEQFKTDFSSLILLFRGLYPFGSGLS